MEKKTWLGVLGGLAYIIIMATLHKLEPIGISINFLGWVQILLAFGGIVLIYGFFKTEPAVWVRTSEKGDPYKKLPEPYPPFFFGMVVVLGIAMVVFILYLAIPKQIFF